MPESTCFRKGLLTVLAGLMAVSANAAWAAGDLPVADKARLSDLVRQDCGSCHGLSLKGGLGRPLLPQNLAHFDRETLAAIILDGIPTTAMPGWRGLLNEEEATWIAGILKEGQLVQ